MMCVHCTCVYLHNSFDADIVLYHVHVNISTNYLVSILLLFCLHFLSSPSLHFFSSFLVGIEWMLPFVMSLGWMLSVGMIVRSVVKEKETRMKEVMRMMGLGRVQLWLSWFITSFLTLLLSVIVISLALSVSINNYMYIPILYTRPICACIHSYI